MTFPATIIFSGVIPGRPKMSQLANRIVAQFNLAQDQDDTIIYGRQNPEALLFLR